MQVKKQQLEVDMKRLTALFAALALTLSLTACAAPKGVAEDGLKLLHNCTHLTR